MRAWLIRLRRWFIGLALLFSGASLDTSKRLLLRRRTGLGKTREAIVRRLAERKGEPTVEAIPPPPAG